MTNCSICSTELKFSNVPAFGVGKLNDTHEICSSCFNKVNSINPHVAFNLKKYSTDDIKSLLQGKPLKNPPVLNTKKGCLIAIGLFILITFLIYTCSSLLSEEEKDSSNISVNEIPANEGSIHLTNGGYYAAISEQYLDEVYTHIADDNKEALDQLVKSKHAFILSPNIQVDIINMELARKVEFKINSDQNTFWARPEAFGESNAIGKEVSKQQYKEKWPFTIQKGILRCITLKFPNMIPLHIIILEAEGKRYAINGTAKNWSKENEYNDSNEIWNSNVPIGKIIEDGLNICR